MVAGEEGQRSLQFFADRVEVICFAHQEIQKLALLHCRSPVQANSVRANRKRRAERGALRRFKLSEAVLAGQAGRVQRMLDGLQAEGEAEVLVHYVG